jgi:hypothetical protein
MGRIVIRGQPREIVQETPISEQNGLEVWLKWQSTCF